jgi:hypothetical protein
MATFTEVAPVDVNTIFPEYEPAAVAAANLIYTGAELIFPVLPSVMVDEKVVLSALTSNPAGGVINTPPEVIFVAAALNEVDDDAVPVFVVSADTVPEVVIWAVGVKVAEAELRGDGVAVEKSFVLLLLSVAPLPARYIAVLDEGAGAVDTVPTGPSQPPVAKTCEPKPTKSTTVTPPAGLTPVSAVVVLTRANLPAACAMLIAVPVASGVGNAVPVACTACVLIKK